MTDWRPSEQIALNLERLSQAQQEAYLKDPAHHCPYCGDERTIDTGCEWHFEDRQILVSVGCHGCGKEWGEIYRLAEMITSV